MPDSSVKMTYHVRRDSTGWSVVHVQSNFPVTVGGYMQVGLDRAEADDLADALNHLESKKNDEFKR